MLLRYDLRPDREGWTVFDVTTDHPAFCVRGWRLFYRRCDPIKNSLKCSRSPWERRQPGRQSGQQDDRPV